MFDSLKKKLPKKRRLLIKVIKITDSSRLGLSPFVQVPITFYSLRTGPRSTLFTIENGLVNGETCLLCPQSEYTDPIKEIQHKFDLISTYYYLTLSQSHMDYGIFSGIKLDILNKKLYCTSKVTWQPTELGIR